MKEPRIKLAAVIAKAIRDASRDENGDVYINISDARQALATVMATLLEAEPLLDTSEKLHEACSLFAAETLVQAEAMRSEYHLTGGRAWMVQSVSLN